MKKIMMALMVGILFGLNLLASAASPALPAEFKDIQPDSWRDFQPDEFILHKRGECSFIEKDVAASSGTAGRMPGNHEQWAIQCKLTEKLVNGEAWSVYVMARCEAGGDTDGNAIRVGIYDDKNRQAITSKYIGVETISGSKYQLIDLGTFDLKPGMFIWVSPCANPNVKNVWVERIFIIKK
jgi:hypothetical protein